MVCDTRRPPTTVGTRDLELPRPWWLVAFSSRIKIQGADSQTTGQSLPAVAELVWPEAAWFFRLLFFGMFALAPHTFAKILVAPEL